VINWSQQQNKTNPQIISSTKWIIFRDQIDLNKDLSCIDFFKVLFLKDQLGSPRFYARPK
jgi:hypothetical protein